MGVLRSQALDQIQQDALDEVHERCAECGDRFHEDDPDGLGGDEMCADCQREADENGNE